MDEEDDIIYEEECYYYQCMCCGTAQSHFNNGHCIKCSGPVYEVTF